MCGIAGVMALDGGAAAGPEQLQAMSKALAHRGPDGDACWTSADRAVALAHRRLAIIDLSTAATQPMADASGRYQIVFNGEIYNHAALREELKAAGRGRWRTDHSDTEVILEAFAHWGIGGVSRLRGMFAFALWDGLARELWLVRDRLGIKPLYYTVHDKRLRFASEIKALLSDRAVPREVDPEALFHFLSFLVPPAPATMFRGVRKLPAGTWLRVSADGRLEERRYWDVLDHARASPDGEDAAADLILERLEDAVRVHKVSDAPMGVFLSGGIDSSTNAVLFSRGERHPVKTFSIGYTGDNPSYRNELEFARLVADRIGAEHHELQLSQSDLESFLPQMVWLQDEPIADPVCVPVFYVSQLARRHGVKVCHVGEGADELFAGYPGWKTALGLERAARWPMAGAAKAIGSAVLAPMASRLGFRYEWLRRSADGQPIFWGGAEAFTHAQKSALLGPEWRGRFRGRSSWEVIAPYWERFQRSDVPKHPLNWMAYLDLNVRLPELLLMRVDKMSMGVGLEARVPYLDHEFVQTAMGIDPELRLRGGVLKYILRKAVRNLLPAQLVDRPKQGFGLPLREWMGPALRAQATRSLETFCRRTGLLDAKAAARVAQRGTSHQAWYLFNLALWWERYVAA